MELTILSHITILSVNGSWNVIGVAEETIGITEDLTLKGVAVINKESVLEIVY